MTPQLDDARPGSAATFAAVDLGAESGRVVAGRLQNGRIALRELHRFANRPVRLPDGLRWDLPGLFGEALEGLRAGGPLAGIGIDAWGCDYALLDERDRMLGLPFHYRDPRTEGMAERAFARVSAPELYATTGIQTLPFNTLFQLLADERSGALGVASRIAFVPDLLALWLTGALRNEATVASTSGLLDARTGDWARELIARLGLPERLFGAIVEPGAPLGPALACHGLGDTPVWAVAGHDTASAFAAAPSGEDGQAAVLSSGTWSLLGLELPGPVLDDPALTNERGMEGTIRLLKNVMGLWLVQECRRAWAADGTDLSYEQLARLAAEATDEQVALFDPDDERLIAPGGMPARIAAACAALGQRAPREPGCCCAASSSRSRAGTAWCWSGWSARAAARSSAST